MSDYHKLSAATKRALVRDRQHEPPLRCPQCDMQLMPAELAEHQAERCPLELPPPHVAARWLGRVAALRYAPASRLDAWVARGLVRQRQDGAYLERDLAIATAWARALEAL